MKFYTNVVQLGNSIGVRGINNGRPFQDRVSFKPRLFLPKSRPGEVTYRNLFGEPLEAMEFGDVADAREFMKNYEGVGNMKIHGNTNWIYQYITEEFPGEIGFDMARMNIQSLDIETASENGFPDIETADQEVLLITLEDYNTKELITYGTRPYTGSKATTDYRFFSDEASMLRSFIDHWVHRCPDIITGWNIGLFDVPYLVHRINRVLGEESANRLSPWKKLRRREIQMNDEIVVAYDILGLSQLDYLDLYKKFTYNKPESYRLDYICKLELGVGKLENPHDTFKDFYSKDWNLFVEYNCIDVQRVNELEEKMRLIELALTMAYDAKCNFSDVYSAVRTWDCILYNHCWDQNIVVHPRDTSRPDRSIVGAFVQDPVPGQYDWVVSFDATSLYPSIIMQYNMSPETLMTETHALEAGTDMPAKVDRLMDKAVAIDHCMSANGYYFRTDKRGLFPEIVAKLFKDRQDYKKLMLAAQQSYEETKDPRYQNEISKYNNFQMARKIQLNSLYGAWANYYFRYFDDRIAEGITLTGQYIIRTVGRALDEYLNKICGTQGFKYSFYSDTDSCYITLDPLVKKFYANKSQDEIVKILDTICEEKITAAINRACADLADYTRAYEQKIWFKREAIATRGLWVAKKRYALNVLNNEGVQYAEPKLKVMGLEIVRSSTPEAIRRLLKEAVSVAITKDEAALQDFILQSRKKYDQLSPEEISFPRGVNNLAKYTSRSDIYAKGTPMHVRGALLYNYYIQERGLGNKYQSIAEGEKIKFIYLRTPNPIKENCIAFIGQLPTELALTSYVDYDTMWQKSFIEPLNGIIESLGWTTSPQATLEDLFA
jgi:DNA polymerase elongation subunit (family B)